MNRCSCLLALAAGAFGCSEPSSSVPAGGSGEGGGGSGSQAGSSGNSTAGGASGSGGHAGSTSNAGTGGQTNPGGAAGGGAGGEPSAPLVVSPSELVFGAVQQTQSAPQTILLENTGSVALQLESIQLDPAAAGTGAFELAAPQPAGELLGGAKQELVVRFNPTSEALFESRVIIQTNRPNLDGSVPLFGLGTQGLEGENEPYLQIVLTALGFDVDVGGAALLSTTTPLVGSEVSAQRFEAAAAGPIELLPVARYSPEEPIPFGYYTAESEVEVGVISSDQYQELNPNIDAGGATSFADPGAPFGLFTVSETHSTYTEDSKNAGNAVQHAVRSYPLKDRAGAAIPNAYLVCFEEAANGDYQDYVFTLSNVKPAAP